VLGRTISFYRIAITTIGPSPSEKFPFRNNAIQIKRGATNVAPLYELSEQSDTTSRQNLDGRSSHHSNYELLL